MKTKLLLIIIAALTGSCAEVPLTLAVQGDYGVYSYSPQRGVAISINATK